MVTKRGDLCLCLFMACSQLPAAPGQPRMDGPAVTTAPRSQISQCFLEACHATPASCCWCKLPAAAIYTSSSRLLSEPAARFGTAGLVPCGDAHCPSQRPGRSRCLLSSSASYQHPTTDRGSDNEHALCPHPAGPAGNEGTAANQPHTCILGLPRARMSRVSRVEASNDPSGRPRTVLAGFPGALAPNAARSRICTQALPLHFPRPAGPVFCTSPHSQGPGVRCSAWVVGNQLTHTAR